MSEKRYTIVRVDYKCPVMLEEKLKVCLSGHSCYHTEKCSYQWGDTKKQFIMKVAQVLYKKELEHWSSTMLLRIGDVGEYVKTNFKAQAIELAKEIVEFLGVK